MYQTPEAIKKKKWRKKRRSFNLLYMSSKYHWCLELLIRASSSGHFTHICLGSHHAKWKSLGVSFPSFITWGLITLCKCFAPLSGAQSGKKRPVLLPCLKHSCSLRPQSDKSTEMKASSQAKYIIEYWEIVSNEMYDPATLSFLISKLQWDLKLPTFMSFTES